MKPIWQEAARFCRVRCEGMESRAILRADRDREGQRTNPVALASRRTVLGTFSRGELIRHDGGCFPIDQVVNAFTSRDSAMVCTTVLLLGPILPESA